LTNVTGSASESYIFDSVGNRTSSSRSASYTYQANNRLTSTATGVYTYNANGTMASKFENGKGLWRFYWDQENRLYEASNKKQKIRYRYDALGRRISRFIAGGKENTKFTYDGNDVVLDDNFGVITKYQNGLGIDNKLKMVTNGVSKYFLQDHLGSTTALTNASGSVIESATYDSFGNATGNLSTRYQFTGREYDNAIGLTYYRAKL
jgi:YD repeat-containing protein